MTMQELPVVKRSSSSLEDDDPNGGVFVEESCSQSTSSYSSSPDNPLFNTFKAQERREEAPLKEDCKVQQVRDNTEIQTTQMRMSYDGMLELPVEQDEEKEGNPSPPNTTTSTAASLTVESFPEAFHASPEPVHHPPPAAIPIAPGDHHYHLLRQIREDEVSDDEPSEYDIDSDDDDNSKYFRPYFTSTKLVYAISKRVFQHEEFAMATWMGFWALGNITCANYVLKPILDAVALQVGIRNLPKLTLASSVLAFLSSVPIGWLFEAPDPSRRQVWKKMGLTRGETQGSSLALFYRFFALTLLMYAAGFQLVDWIQNGTLSFLGITNNWFVVATTDEHQQQRSLSAIIWWWVPYILSQLGSLMYIAFFLVVHLAKLHSISLVWGVTTEAMEYEDVARKGHEPNNLPKQQQNPAVSNKKPKTRLQRLAMVSFGGTLGGIWGSIIASSMANILHLPGLLVVAAFLLEIAAELSTELGRIMQKHWEEQQIFKSCLDLTSLDPSMKRSNSLGSMKRIASGNSLYQESLKRVASGNSINQSLSTTSLSELDDNKTHAATTTKPFDTLQATFNINNNNNNTLQATDIKHITPEPDDNTFTQRLLRGIRTILNSRLLMAIFTYNALFASTSVLLSFQRAELVVNRNDGTTTVSADTAFLANINMASSMAVFAFQASGIGAIIAQKCGPQGSLALMPIIRLFGVLSLAWWHRSSNGQAPNLILFLMLDECTRVVNLAVAKPVRESLWRGLSNEARYEAKPIVDTLANRWGAGSASFCVSVVSKTLLWIGMTATAGADPEIFGLPPVLFLCLIVAAWWAMVSLDLGHIRSRIDMELKKHQ